MVVLVDHTAGVYATDLAAAKFEVKINVADVESAKTAAQAAQVAAELAETNAETAETNAETAQAAAEAAQATATTQAGIATAQATIATTKAGEAATSEANAQGHANTAAAAAATAQAVVDGVMWRDVAYLTVADSPLTLDATYGGKLLVVDTSGGNVIINLPSVAALTLPWSVGIKKRGAASTITVNRNGTDTIDTGTSLTLTSDGEDGILVADDSPNPDDWTKIGFFAAPGTASEGTAGVIELATQAETDTGTDDTRAITPLKFATRMVAYVASALSSWWTSAKAAAQTLTAAWGYTFQTVAYSASITWNVSTHPAAKIALTGSPTITAIGIEDGKVYQIRLSQDATGSRVPSLDTNVFKGGDDGLPTYSTTASKTDYSTFVGRVDGGNSYLDHMGTNLGF
jgi:hypothetical protein